MLTQDTIRRFEMVDARPFASQPFGAQFVIDRLFRMEIVFVRDAAGRICALGSHPDGATVGAQRPGNGADDAFAVRRAPGVDCGVGHEPFAEMTVR